MKQPKMFDERLSSSGMTAAPPSRSELKTHQKHDMRLKVTVIPSSGNHSSTHLSHTNNNISNLTINNGIA